MTKNRLRGGCSCPFFCKPVKSIEMLHRVETGNMVFYSNGKGVSLFQEAWRQAIMDYAKTHGCNITPEVSLTVPENSAHSSLKQVFHL